MEITSGTCFGLSPVVTNPSKYLNFAPVIVSVLLIFGCKMPGPSKELTNQATVLAKTHSHDTIYAGNSDTLLLLKNGEVFVKGSIAAGKINSRYTIPTWKGQQVMAYLSQEIKGGSLCIKEIDAPGSEPKGPYGDSVNLSMERSGNLCLKIGGKTTGKQRYNGNFVLHVVVK